MLASEFRCLALSALAFSAVFAGCSKPVAKGAEGWSPGGGFLSFGARARLLSRNVEDFEAGNAGRVAQVADGRFEVDLRSDNDDALPKFWRNWFYVKLADVPVGTPVTITIKGAGIGSYYLPVFSYDVRPDRRNADRSWTQFRERDVTQPEPLTVQITATFTEPTVYVARWNPYTYTRLVGFLGTLRGKPGVTLGSIGQTPRGREIPSVTVTGPAARRKQRIMIHARTHPGEVGSNFMLEGLLQFATGPGADARRLRAKAVLDVVPMLNVDGVIAGNNRVTPTGVNLEGKWYAAEEGPGAVPRALDPERTPPEVMLLHAFVEDRLADGVPPTVALNLHASAGEPDDNVFFFPHFGPRARGYDQAEANLNRKQLRFIGEMRRAHGAPWFNVPPEDGKATFAARSLPESWWWRHFGDQVMAMTIESTYGRAARSSRWVTPEDMRRMGYSLGLALLRYVDGETVGPPTGARVADLSR